MIIELTPTELQEATDVGKKRRAFNESKRTSAAYGFDNANKEKALKIDIQGAIAEKSIAKTLNLNWIPFSEEFKTLVSDVGDNVQVRSTDYKQGNLLVHPKDKDEQIFILVRLHNLPKCEIVGWIKGKDGKKQQYWEDGTNWPAFKNRPCYRVPAYKLNLIEDLMK